MASIKEANERIVKQWKLDQRLLKRLQSKAQMEISLVNPTIQSIFETTKSPERELRLDNELKGLHIDLLPSMVETALEWYRDSKELLFPKLEDDARQFIFTVVSASLANYLNFFYRFAMQARNDYDAIRAKSEQRAAPIYYESWGQYWSGKRSLKSSSLGKAVAVRTAAQSKQKLGLKSKANFWLTPINKQIQEIIEDEIENALDKVSTKLSNNLVKKPFNQFSAGASIKIAIRKISDLEKPKRGTFYKSSYEPRGEGVLFIGQDDISFYVDETRSLKPRMTNKPVSGVHNELSISL